MNSENTENRVVTRFAPSPTGFMHVGGVRTAIFAYLWAKKNKGAFILRIEDTDKEREVSGSQEHIIEVLKWLGVDWDQGPDIGGIHAPYVQSERLEIYQTYAHKLIESGFAYVDGMSEEEAEVLRQQAEENKKPFLYREHRKESTAAYTGIGQTLRFKIHEVKESAWDDVVFGKLTAGAEALDDFVLIKADGYPTYNFAHIVDDIEMGVTHVMRGQEFISSTPKYLALYEALGQTPPVFVSLPHILGDAGQKKLGKRDGAKDALEYKDEGYAKEAMFNFLAFLGFNPGGEKEIYTKAELAEVFDIERIQKSGARFNDDKLDWFNKEHMKLLPFEEQVKQVALHLESYKTSPFFTDTLVQKITPIVIDHITKWSDIQTLIENGEFSYYFNNTVTIDDISKINWKENTPEKTKECLTKALEIIETLDEGTWSYDSIKQAIWPITDTYGRGDILWPLRYVLSGKDKSPDPFMLIYILGKERVVERVKKIL